MMMTERGAWYCENCDFLQAHEPFGMARRKTQYDIRFDMSWLRTINQEYKDNTTPPAVGTTNPADEEDTSPEDEGETNDAE